MPAPTRTTCAKEIADWWRDKIKEDLSASGELNLKTCMSCDLESYTADFDSDVNAVFVIGIDDRPSGDHGAPGGMLDIESRTWRDVYRYRVVWLSPRVEAAGEHQETSRYKVQRLADEIRAYPTMAGVSGLPAGVKQVELATCDVVEFRPPEDQYEALMKARLVAAAIEFSVRVIASLD